MPTTAAGATDANTPASSRARAGLAVAEGAAVRSGVRLPPGAPQVPEVLDLETHGQLHYKVSKASASTLKGAKAILHWYMQN